MEFNFRYELGKITPKLALGAKLYVFGAGPHWEHILRMYDHLVHTDLNDYIDGFIDNDPTKQGTLFHGKPVIALSEADTNHLVVLIATATGRANNEIAWQLTKHGMFCRHNFFTVDVFWTTLMRYEYLQLMQFKDKHRGERCFIIGNGPSLSVADLDKLNGEVTFATNKIYLLFDKTVWRPNYYMIHDEAILRQSREDINKKITCDKFFAYNGELTLDNGYFYVLDGKVDWKPYPYHKPEFSEEPFVMQWGATVTYDCIQLAAYMGFNEIYLLGIDHHFSTTVKINGELITDDVENHFTPEYKFSSPYHSLIDFTNAAYEKANEYAKAHRIKLMNATRGGELEAFERINFDSLFA
ncbi:6-hydroxymethylpterin diphosphokinase MptE-like protein [Cohnella lubricantis]|uniref:DUF115 domain-containing protein n=1 Tax=Cohnella lubricantis TaxID=2163172 RepID=A0A841T790_9BACL|nr:6-hydroxymethylpterin diphosphokinase MptE-like protein [Cohnella lubricantis]MBB6677393.1 DUF115 domain-containing protein [Cohnella lubricantis]MBP2118716.1 hypothetical protein [Cohnella lubricantis]